MAAEKSSAAAAQNPVRLVAQKKIVIVTVQNVFTTVGSGIINLKGTVKTADGTPVKQGEVKLKFNGTLWDYAPIYTSPGSPSGYASIATDDAGTISYSLAWDIDTTKELHLGANTMEVEFTGKNEFLPGRGTTQLSILKAPTKIAYLKIPTNDEANSSPGGCLVIQGKDSCEWGIRYGKILMPGRK